jgi:hypothetical protein
MAKGKSTRTDPVYCTRNCQPSRSDRFRSNGLFDACPSGPKYTCSNYYDNLGNGDRVGLTAARRRTLHPTSSTGSGTSRKSLIPEEVSGSVVVSGSPDRGGRGREQSTLQFSNVAHLLVQRRASESWEHHIARWRDYPRFLHPYRLCHSHPFGRLHRFNGIHVSARKAFVFLLDSLDGGTDHNTLDRIRYAYMSGAS